MLPASRGARGRTADHPAGDPLRPDAPPKRLVMRTRRTYSRAAALRIAFGGFPLTHAREQSGAIGVTQSPNLWISPAMSRGLRRIETGGLPPDLRERPSTRLAFEFVDQRFLLQLDVEASPPLLRSQSQTAFRIDADHARSEANIELQWVRGQLFEVELDIGPGLEVVSVGPNEVVEGWSLSGEFDPRLGGSAHRGGVLKIGLTSRGARTDEGELQLKGYQRIPRDGPVKLGLFAPDASTAVAASYTLSADRSLSVELDDDTGQVDRAGGDASGRRSNPASLDRPASSPGESRRAGTPLLLAGQSGPLVRCRSGSRDTPVRSLSRPSLRRGLATDGGRAPGRPPFTVRHGASTRWRSASPRDRRIIGSCSTARSWTGSRLGREADGTRHLPLILRSAGARQGRTFTSATACRSPRISTRPGRGTWPCPGSHSQEAVAGPVRLELAMAPGILFQGNDPAWIPVAENGPADRGNPTGTLAFTSSPGPAGPAVHLQSPGPGSGRPALAGDSPPADPHSCRASTARSAVGPVTGSRSMGRSSPSRCPRKPAGSPLGLTAGSPTRWITTPPDPDIDCGFPRRPALATSRRAGIPARWPGRRVAMARPAAPRRRRRARDVLGCAAPVGSGDRRSPAGLVR